MERGQAREAEIMIDPAPRPAGPAWPAEHTGRSTASVRDVLIVESEASAIHTYGGQTVPRSARAEPNARHPAPVRGVELELSATTDRLTSVHTVLGAGLGSAGVGRLESAT
jgi:hypothetical protein